MRVAMALVVFALILIGAVFLIPAEKVAALAVREFSKITGRDLEISGSVRPSFYPVLGVKTGPISVANAGWSKEGPLLQAASMEISLDMTALMSGTVRITGLQVTDPVIVLERDEAGLANWDFRAVADGGGTAGPDTPGQGTPFTLDKAVITGGRVRYMDHATGRVAELSRIEAAVSLPDFNGAATLKGAAQMGGQQIAISGRVAEFAPFLSGRLVPVTLLAQAGAADIKFEGQASMTPFAAEGALTADLGDMAAMFGLAGMAAPALPEGLGARAVSVTGAVTLTAEGSAHLRGGTLTLDGNVLSGDLDYVTAGARPKLSAKLMAQDLVLGRAAPSAGGGKAAAAPDGWSTDAVDVSGLAALDAAVALTATSLDLGTAKTGPLKVLVTVDRARAVFELRELSVYGGGVTGQFVINGRNGLSVGGDLRFAEIALQPMLSGLAGYDRVTGTGDADLKFLAVGNSQDALMQSLSGSGTLSLTRGEVAGVDVPGILRTLDTSYVGAGTKTVYDAVTGSFVIDGGVLSNDDLVLDAPGLTATGNGTVGIGARDLEYRVRPTAVIIGGVSDGVAVPLLITGPWASPTFRLDLETVAQEKLQAEAARLQDKAEAALAEKLGIEAQEGESLKDAARRKLNDAIDEEAARALEKLLGGGN